MQFSRFFHHIPQNIQIPSLCVRQKDKMQFAPRQRRIIAGRGDSPDVAISFGLGDSQGYFVPSE